MTVTAFATITPPATSVTEAMFRAEYKAANFTAVYIIGCGALLATALFIWSYSTPFSGMLHTPSLVALAVAVLWMAIGGKLMQRRYQEVKTCTALYEAHIQRQMQLRMAHKAASANTAQAVTLPEAAALTTQKLLALCLPAPTGLPRSIFGAYLSASVEAKDR